MDKITYASLGNLGEDFHRAFDAALVHERKKLGAVHPMFIGGKPVKAKKPAAKKADGDTAAKPKATKAKAATKSKTAAKPKAAAKPKKAES